MLCLRCALAHTLGAVRRDSGRRWLRPAAGGAIARGVQRRRRRLRWRGGRGPAHAVWRLRPAIQGRASNGVLPTKESKNILSAPVTLRQTPGIEYVDVISRREAPAKKLGCFPARSAGVFFTVPVPHRNKHPLIFFKRTASRADREISTL